MSAATPMHVGAPSPMPPKGRYQKLHTVTTKAKMSLYPGRQATEPYVNDHVHEKHEEIEHILQHEYQEHIEANFNRDRYV